MQLFATEDLVDPDAPAPKPVRKPVPVPRPPEGVAPPAPPKKESAYQARERLRAARRVLVADVSRRTNESHQQVNGRINRMTGVQSVSKATIQQLEKGNVLLERDLK